MIRRAAPLAPDGNDRRINEIGRGNAFSRNRVLHPGAAFPARGGCGMGRRRQGREDAQQMAGSTPQDRLSGRMAETLYTEAMLLADELRSYFEGEGREERADLDARGKVLFACESLKATTRLMHVIAWLAGQRAIARGERPPSEPLGAAAPSDAQVLGRMPSNARRLVLAGIDLHERVARFAAGVEAPIALASPARVLIQRLERAF